MAGLLPIFVILDQDVFIQIQMMRFERELHFGLAIKLKETMPESCPFSQIFSRG